MKTTMGKDNNTIKEPSKESKYSGLKLILAHYTKEMKKHPFLASSVFVLLPAQIFFLNFAVPYIVADVIDQLSKSGTIPVGQVWDMFGLSIILLAGSIILGQIILQNINIYLSAMLELEVRYALYLKCFHFLSNQSSDFHQNRFGGTLVSQTNKFVSSFDRFFEVVSFNFFGLLLHFLFTVIILGVRVPFFALGIAIISIIFTVYTLRGFGKIKDLNEKESQANNKLSGHISDTITNILAVKSFGAEDRESESFKGYDEKASVAYREVISAIVRRNIGVGFLLVLLAVFMLASILYGQAIVGVSIGTMVLMLTYSMNLFGTLWRVPNIARNVNKIYGDALPMAELLSGKMTVNDRDKPQAVRIKAGEIAFEDVTFSYGGQSKNVFEDFSLTLEPGKKVGLVGHSGSGKSTLTKLLLRFADVKAGTVKIDGQDVRDLRQAEFRKYIAYVPQEPLLFHRSISENIAYGKPNATEDEISEAARRAQVLEFVGHLPDGFETLVGERGVKLSGGQRQRIAIARAILKDAPILLLDEATSSLDSESEGHIQKAFEELMKDRTSIVVAHRLSTIQKMDRIVVLEDGKVIEDGTHRNLLEKEGTYAHLWKMQSGGFLEE